MLSLTGTVGTLRADLEDEGQQSVREWQLSGESVRSEISSLVHRIHSSRYLAQSHSNQGKIIDHSTNIPIRLVSSLLSMVQSLSEIQTSPVINFLHDSN